MKKVLHKLIFHLIKEQNPHTRLLEPTRLLDRQKYYENYEMDHLSSYIYFLLAKKVQKRLHSLVLNITRKCHCQPTLMISRSLWPMKSTACCDILDTLLQYVLYQINIFCQYLNQIMTTDFVRFTSFASFELQNNLCKSSQIWQI